MKAIAKTCMILAVLTVVSFGVMASEPATDTVAGAGAKHKSLFVHKAQKRLLGGQVEIFSNGELLATQILNKKKMVIDFNQAKLGMYTIRITKGIDRREFQYVKK